MTKNDPSADGMNLTTHHGTASAWNRRGWHGTPEQLAATRWLVGIGGAALAIQGVRQRTRTGGMLVGLGGGLAWWALTGEGDLSEARQWFTRALQPWFRPEDHVQRASTESFPASDAPSRTPTVGTGVRRDA
jgi:hypothetical protein